MTFFQTLNFSSINEDGETELAALAGARRIVCITGSGSRPLDMLLTEADEVIAVDMNPAQNALLALKIAAIESLNHAELLAFLGLAPDASRITRYDMLRPRLPVSARDYWDRNRRMIASGVWNAGKWDRLMRWNARFLKIFRGKAVDALMNAPTIDDQARIWRRSFTAGKLLAAIEVIGRDLVWRWVMREPSGEFVPDPKAVGKRLASDFETASRSFLFRDSDCAVLIFRGALHPGGALPPHLRPENYSRLRQNLSRLRIVEGGLASLGELGISEVDGFSLSDFGSYCGPDVYAACWKGILSVAAPGARFCERTFMNDMPPPFPEIREDRALSERLCASDKSIVYRVRAGHINDLN